MQRIGWRHTVRIVWDLGWSEFRLKYRGSVLGYFWSFAVPFVKFFVFLYVFKVLFAVDIPFYPLYLFLGIILWEYFTNVTTACLSVPLTYEHIIQKVAFPRFLLILTVGWTQAIVFLTHLVIFGVMSVFMGVAPSFSALYFFIVYIQLALLSLGIGAFLASYALRFRDFPHMWNIVLQILFWLTPITYMHKVDTSTTAEFLQILSHPRLLFGWGSFAFFTRMQPLSLIIFDARRVLLPIGVSVPSLIHAVILTLLCGGIFAAGFLVFRKRSRSFLQEY